MISNYYCVLNYYARFAALKKFLKLILIALFIATFTSMVQAKPLIIQITGGKNFGVPIAIADFAGNEDFTGYSGYQKNRERRDITDIASVIRNDLSNCGQFRVMERQDMLAQPQDAAAIDEYKWRNTIAEHLVIGQIEPIGHGGYVINFQLIDLYKSKTAPTLSMRFKVKSSDEFRALAHHISDKIFEKIIGIRGFFSTRIAYITVEQQGKQIIHTLTIADSDGYNDQALVSAKHPLMSPAWSPDAKHLAFVGLTDNQAEINIVEIRTGKVRRITAFPGINSAPAWSPDGRSLALVLSKGTKGGEAKLYTLNLESKQIKQITFGAGIDTEPFWDKDGASIVFTSNRGGKPQIYRVILATGSVSRLTFTGDYNATPSLTPDGKTLVMLHKTDTGFHIATQSLVNGKVRVLTSARLDESPTLAPNGMMILYGTLEGNKLVLGAVSLDGRFKMRLPMQDSSVKEPVWSPYLL